MAVLLLRFAAPMQAWGSRSKFEYRDSEREPTFSGVVGIIAAAEGKQRDADLSPYRALSMTVRVDREGRLSREFQTALGVVTASGKISRDAQMIHRDYLSDAVFHVALAGPVDVLRRVHSALMRPVFPTYLGRKSYVPAVPVVYPESESYIEDETDPLTVLRRLPVTDRQHQLPIHLPVAATSSDSPQSRTLRFVITSEVPTEEVRQDVPIDFGVDRRRYAARFVKTQYHEVLLARTEEVYS